jgi:N-acyl-D-aspartate/D-glutamate deacylase
VYDLVIRGGTVVDGTGGEPYLASVGVRDGLIVAVGDIAELGTEELDATGLVVTPGFVDVHTHYDAQLTWDPLATPSIWHGVTTVVVGNCGVGFAPAPPDRRDWLIGLMEGVEDIPGAALREALRWDWESVPDYLDALDRLPLAIDVVVQVAHGAVRAFVMGERGAANEPATAEDIERMAAVVREAVAAGAVGVSVNRLERHMASDGRPVPGTFAGLDEVFALAHAVREGAGNRDALFAVIFPDATFHDEAAYRAEVDWVARLTRETGLRATFPFGASTDGSEDWRGTLAHIEALNRNGAHLRPQIGAHLQALLCGLTTRHPFMGSPTERSLGRLTPQERAARMAEPAVRAAIVAEAHAGQTLGLLQLMLREAEAVFPMTTPWNHEPDPATSLAGVAERTGRDPVEILYDWTIADEGRALICYMLNGYPGSLDGTLELLTHPETVLGLGDGGAHVGLICDASYPSHVLSHWARDRRPATLPIARAVEQLTSRPAAMLGLRDRGTIAPGLRADLNVIDPAAVRLHRHEVVRDLPGNAKRVLQRADGYVATVVAGEIVQRDGADTGARPGRVVRPSEATP